MLYNSLREKLPVLATQPTHDFLCFLLTHPVFHSSTTSPPPSNPTPFPLTSFWKRRSHAVLLSGMSWYFTGWAPVRVGRPVFGGHSQSKSVWLGVTQPPWPDAALNHSLNRGVSPPPPTSFLRPIFDSVGLQTHPITGPIFPLWSANFLIYACKLYIFSSVKAGTPSLLGIYFLRSWAWVFYNRALRPQVF